MVKPLVVPGLVFFIQGHTETKDLHQRPSDALTCCLQLKCSGHRLPAEKKPLTSMKLQQYCSFCHEASFSSTETKEAFDLKARRKTKEQCLEVHKGNDGKTTTSLKLLSQQHRTIQLRERKATQMLAIVLGEFQALWKSYLCKSDCQRRHSTKASRTVSQPSFVVVFKNEFDQKNSFREQSRVPPDGCMLLAAAQGGHKIASLLYMLGLA